MTAACRRALALACLTAVLIAPAGRSLPAQATVAAAKRGSLPDRLTDAEFWKLLNDVSEPGGVFSMADNFVSNEGQIGVLAGRIRDGGPHGGVYMGVGPEQNLTYITAVRPAMVFIVDIRRQAVMHHLLYKAIFEVAKDPADFISVLFAKPRPGGVDSTTRIDSVWAAFEPVPTDTALGRVTLERLTALMTRTHGFAFTREEQMYFDHVYRSFVTFGPAITTSGPATGVRFAIPRVTTDSGLTFVRGGATAAASGAVVTTSGVVITAPPGRTITIPSGAVATPGVTGAPTPAFTSLRTMPTVANFAWLTQVRDERGQFDAFLGSWEAFRFLKDLHARNLFVPTSGNFGGTKAIRAVANYVKQHGATVSAFYVSNVESYLFRDGLATAFYANVAALPTDSASIFIRPGGSSVSSPAAPSALCPIGRFLAAVARSAVTTNAVAVSCPR